MTPTMKLLIRAGAGAAGLGGAWSIVAPWVLPGPYPPGPTWNGVVVGALVLALAGLKGLAVGVRWVSWAGILLGVWLMLSPWVIGYGEYASPLRNDTLTGLAIVLGSSVAALATLAAEGLGGSPAAA